MTTWMTSQVPIRIKAIIFFLNIIQVIDDTSKCNWQLSLPSFLVDQVTAKQRNGKHMHFSNQQMHLKGMNSSLLSQFLFIIILFESLY